jgi:Flp pilus assembly protein TadG
MTSPHPRQRRAADHARGAARRGDAGSVTLELSVLAPAVLILLVLVIVAGRLSIAHQEVDHAAQTAARAATLARDPATATSAATSAARRELDTGDLHCAAVRVRVDTSGFAIAVGRPASVTATVTCTVSLSGLAVPGIPGSRQVTATATSPLDTYRGRS